MNWTDSHLLALLCGFGLDFLLGDPHGMPHPVRFFGWLISALEKGLRGILPKTQRGKRLAGILLVLLLLMILGSITVGILYVSKVISPYIYFLVQVIICYQMMAARSLNIESMRVFIALQSGDIHDARQAVSMIVGRDTDTLDACGITKATVETVAENTSDGVIAPLIYMAFFGAIGGVIYKAVNTMDSMVGYRNEKYIDFGRGAAKLDDVLNFIPSRISGLLMCLSAPLCGMDGAGASRVFRRDRHNHSSPNSAQTESACAGALGIQLGGGGFYFGSWVQKPTIGDALRDIAIDDIPKSNRLMYTTAVLSLLLFCILPLILL